MKSKDKTEKHWYTAEEMKNMKKSDFYRENLAQLLGKKIVMDAPYYQFEPYKEDKDRACFRRAKVVIVGDQMLEPFL